MGREERRRQRRRQHRRRRQGASHGAAGRSAARGRVRVWCVRLLRSTSTSSSSSSEVRRPIARAISVSPSCFSHRLAMRQANSLHSIWPLLSKSRLLITSWICAPSEADRCRSATARRGVQTETAMALWQATEERGHNGGGGARTPASVIGDPSCCMTDLSSLLSLRAGTRSSVRDAAHEREEGLA